MKNTLPTSLILFVMIGILTPAFAEVPQQPQFRDYAHLLKRSPFTIKVNKVVKRATEKKKPANYFLRGVTKFGDKWTAIIFERNKPKENIFLKEGSSSKGVKLITVSQHKENYKLTKAEIEVDSETISIGYRLDELLSKAVPKTKEIKKNRAIKQPQKKPKWHSKIPKQKDKAGAESPDSAGLLPAYEEKGPSLPQLR